MTRTLRLFLGSMAWAGLMFHSAMAADVYNNITLDEFRTVLSAKFDTRDDKANGIDFLWVQGKNHLIAAQLVHCDNVNCEGVRYFAVLKKNPSASAVNEFNRDHDYSKMTLTADGQGIMSIEHLVTGGVTGDNVAQNALALMYRLTQFYSTDVTASLRTPLPTAALAAARADEAWVRGQPVATADPALVKATIELIAPAK